jgi:maleamate amidohydrolase
MEMVIAMAGRVWDKFLTDQDKAHATRQPPVERGVGSRPVLLLVDLYRNAFGDRREPLLQAIQTWPSSCGEAGWEALPHIRHLLGAARNLAIPVVHVTGLPELPSWREERLVDGRGADAALRARQFEIMDEVAPIDGEIVLRKAAPSAFWGTPLAGLLHQLQADSLVIAGETTSGCVRATVVDACSFRYKVTVVEECVFDRTEAAHAINLFDIAHKYADVIGLDIAIQRLGGATPRGLIAKAAEERVSRTAAQ